MRLIHHFRTHAAFIAVLSFATLGAVLASAAVPVPANKPPIPETAAQILSSQDHKTYRAAFAALQSGNWTRARKLAARAQNPLPRWFIDWQYYRQIGNRAGFVEINAFLGRHPDWPDQSAIRRMAEQAIDGQLSDDQVLAWFSDRDPVSGAGKVRLAEAQIRKNKQGKGIERLRESWVNDRFPRRHSRRIYRRHKRHFTVDDHIARLDRLLWEGRRGAARRMLPLVPNGWRRLAEARISLMARAPDVDHRIRRVPKELLNDAGLAFERTRWRRRKKLDDHARMILLDPPDQVGPRPEVWWTERKIATRKALDDGLIDEAYRIASEHGLKSGTAAYAEAEWLAGWIAFRFKNRNHRAFGHFNRLYDAVKYPISRARGAYWSARVARTLSDERQAMAWLERAAQHPTTFYGQLAIEELDKQSDLPLPKMPVPTTEEIAQFESLELVRLIRAMSELRQTDKLRPFLLALIDRTTHPEARMLTADLALQIDRPEYAVRSAKRAAQAGTVLVDTGFPVQNMEGLAAEPALLHALTRQESEFNHRAISSAGARGLMQLMPATARLVSKQLGLRYSRQRLLDDPDYNKRLGAAYIGRLIQAYDGSYILAIAAYNAGPGRVRRWIKTFGDPRDATVDVVDWIERIPISETRNYVQRVMEGLQVYRERLANGPEPVALHRDLKRGRITTARK